MTREFAKLLDDLAAYLRYEKEEGRLTVEADREKVRRLGNGLALGLRPVSPPAPQPDVAFAPGGASTPAAATGAMPGRVSEAERAAKLKEIAARIARCRRCPLHEGRTKPVPGQGALSPDIMFVGEGPGYEEDQQGLAFVGKAGQLLTKIIEATGYTREQVFIGNVVKCRPPGNRTPLPDEMAACLPYLQEQIAVVQPRIIVALGATALRGLLNVQAGITKVRGRWLEYQGIPVMPTYHPAYLLRNPAGKPEVWEDMKAVLAKLGKKPPPRKASRPSR